MMLTSFPQPAFERQKVLEYIRDPDDSEAKLPSHLTPAMVHARLDQIKLKMDAEAADAALGEPSYRSRDEIKS
jgi:hypothetical protein